MGAVETTGVFAGNERFEVLGLLGQGASGTVYEAFDRKRQIRVALKTLTQLDADVRYRFKREFRALSNVRHQHVVELFELSTDAEPWFFTMELVEGTDLMTHLRGESAPAGDTMLTQRARASDATRMSVRPSEPQDVERVRRVFAQLCRGLNALHEQGLLHRDVKPSNVLVSGEGRVVLVDFGIVAEIDQVTLRRSGDLEAVVGTPAYMAPEQGSGETAAAASDWYAVGVMLFQALTGRLPFEEAGIEALMSKLERAAPSVTSLVSSTPPELAALCDRLLAQEPMDRPSFAEIMEHLGQRVRPSLREAPDAGVFVGRESELGQLHAALAEVRTGHPVLVHVPGTSGMGKSELLARFLRDVSASGAGVVLQGRCCERESVPFKALDDLIDALAVQLSALPDEGLPALPAGGAAALVRLFPVLAQVPSLAPFDTALRRARETDHEGGYSRQTRALALAALRVILHELATAQPVVLAIDDAQWGDEDSAALLSELVAPPLPPAVLIVLAYRKEWAGRAPLLAALGPGQSMALRKVPVEPLPEARARALAGHWLGSAADAAATDAIVAEAGGSPFFLMEFARHVRLAGSHATRLDLAQVLLRRFGELDEAPRRLLEALAVGARPLDPLLAARAAGLVPEQGAAALRALRLAHLVRDNDRAGTARVETFHDRVRETLVSHLERERIIAQHERFVSALSELAPGDVEALYQHCRGAGQTARASHYAALAATEAVNSMAFVRAAELFAAALELAPEGEERAQSWRVARANALAYAGRRKDAAEAYLAAAEAMASAPMESVWLSCSAIEQYLAGGHPDLGMPIAARTLRELGLPLAESRNGALLSMAGRMVWLRLRGSGFKERSESEVPAAQLAQIDAAHRVARGVSITDPIRGGEMFLRTVSLSLKAGEIKRISVAVSCMSTMLAIEGPSPYAKKLLDQGVELANRSQDAHSMAVATMNEGCVLALNGFWSEALDKLERTDVIFQRLRGLETADQQNARSVQLLVRYYLGRIAELIQLVPAAVADAVQRGDAYSRSLLTTSKASLCWLATDEPERHAELNTTGLTTKARGNNLCIEHICGLINLVDNDLYVGRPERAMERLLETLPAAKASLMLRMVITSTQVNDVHARAALMMALLGKEPGEHRRLALSLAKRIGKHALPWPTATATMLEAGEADVDGRAEQAAALYRRALGEFEAANMALHATAARLRLGQWLGGDEGATLVRDAEQWMKAQGIVNSASMARMLAPSRYDLK